MMVVLLQKSGVVFLFPSLILGILIQKSGINWKWYLWSEWNLKLRICVGGGREETLCVIQKVKQISWLFLFHTLIMVILIQKSRRKCPLCKLIGHWYAWSGWNLKLRFWV